MPTKPAVTITFTLTLRNALVNLQPVLICIFIME
jgi:hypothetical protein